MTYEWTSISHEVQESLSRKALCLARHLVSTQAELLAQKMEQGALPPLDGPDALRMLSMILDDENASM